MKPPFPMDFAEILRRRMGLAWRRVASARAQRSQRGHADVAGIYFEEQQRCPETEVPREDSSGGNGGFMIFFMGI